MHQDMTFTFVYCRHLKTSIEGIAQVCATNCLRNMFAMDVRDLVMVFIGDVHINGLKKYIYTYDQ